MMGFVASLLITALGAQQAQPSAQLLAQAHDRCMTTSAVRLTRTDATDEQIFDRAVQSCLPLKGQLNAAITAQLPPAQAAEILQSLDAQAKPNFLNLLARIRSDRARRAGE